MGSFKETKCTECNFKIVTEGRDNFYIDHETDELKEFMYLQLTRIDEEDMKIFGHTERTYCPNCDKLIKSFVITETAYSKEESINRLEEIIKRTDINENHNIDLLIGFQEKDERIRIAFNEDREKEIIDNEFLEKFRNSENVLTIVEFEESRDFETVEEYREYEKTKDTRKLTVLNAIKIYRNFQDKKCHICENNLEIGHMVNID